jgi:hypothetical protein
LLGLWDVEKIIRKYKSNHITGTAANANNIIPVYVPIDVVLIVVFVLFARVMMGISICYI